jgi:site-specific DNA recombinase
MRAALYARVSTEDQAKEGFSIPAQSKRLNSYCKARGWTVAAEYVDDGYSGRDVRRPAYHRMMEEKDRWDVLLVLKMDRIHRNSRNFAVMMDNLEDWKKEFNSMQEAFDTTTAIGRFVMDTIQRIAQLESEQIGERVKVGMAQKAKKGAGYLGFGQPYGFVYADKKLVANAEEAEVVRRIFRLYLGLSSLSEISDGLNAEQVPTKNGGRWEKGTVASILRNPLYCGFVEWDGLVKKARHERLIDIPEFNAVQDLMIERARGPASQKHRHLEAEAGEASG